MFWSNDACCVAESGAVELLDIFDEDDNDVVHALRVDSLVSSESVAVKVELLAPPRSATTRHKPRRRKGGREYEPKLIDDPLSLPPSKLALLARLLLSCLLWLLGCCGLLELLPAVAWGTEL